jgi:hypothetical protein
MLIPLSLVIYHPQRLVAQPVASPRRVRKCSLFFAYSSPNTLTENSQYSDSENSSKLVLRHATFITIISMGATHNEQLQDMKIMTEQLQDMEIMTEAQRIKMSHFMDISTYTPFTDIYIYFDNLAHGPHRTQGDLISSYRLGMSSTKKGKIFKSTPDAWKY